MHELLLIAHLSLWIVIAGLGLLVLALTKQLSGLFSQVAPAGALSVNQVLQVRQQAPQMTVELLDSQSLAIGGHRGQRSQLLFFLSTDCPICRSLLPVLRSLRNSEAWLDIVLASDGGRLADHSAYVAEYRLGEFDYVVSESLGRAYGVAKVPYAVLVDEQGAVSAMGIVNSREHLESLFEAKERNVASIQEYLQSQQSDGNFYQA